VLSRLVGRRDMLATSMGVEIDTGRGRIEILTREAFRHRYGAEPAGEGPGPRFAGVRIRVDDPGRAAQLFAARGVPFARAGEAVVAPAEAACGVAVAFGA
jgi:hypothetical protein